MNVDRLVCGLAVPFNEPPERDDAAQFTREQFELWLDLLGELAVPLMIQHQAVVDGHGVTQSIGAARWFTLLDADPPRPAGLLVLAEVDRTPVGDGVLRAVEHGGLGGLSIRVTYEPGGHAWVHEISLVHDPGFAQARVVGVGPRALTVWELLGGAPVAAEAAP